MKNKLKKGILGIVLLLSFFGEVHAALLTNIVHYWKLDESSGNASDSVGSITLTNNGTGTYSPAKINNGFTGNGSTSYLNTTTEALSTTQLTGTWSVNFWIKRLANPAGASYAFRINGTTLGVTTYVILYYFSGGTWHLNTGGGDVALTYTDTGNLDMLTLTYDGAGTVKFYVNGTQSGGNITFTPGTTAGAVTGKFSMLNDPDGGAPLNAQIDEFGIWTQTLSTTDITSLYNSGAGKQYPFTTVANSTPNTLGFFRFMNAHR